MPKELDFSQVGKDRGYTGQYADNHINQTPVFEPDRTEAPQPYNVHAARKKLWKHVDELISKAKKDFEPYDGKIKELKKKMNEFVVKDDETAAACGNMVAKCKKLIKKMEEERKKEINHEGGYVNSVNNFVKGFRDSIGEIVKSGDKKLANYNWQKELKRREDEKKARKAQEKLQAEMDKKAKKAGVEPVQMPVMTVPKKETVIRTEAGTSFLKTEWTWEAEDNAMDVIPRNYLMLDSKSISAAVKAGIRKIEGIRIFEAPKNITRTT